MVLPLDRNSGRQPLRWESRTGCSFLSMASAWKLGSLEGGTSGRRLSPVKVGYVSIVACRERLQSTHSGRSSATPFDPDHVAVNVSKFDLFGLVLIVGSLMQPEVPSNVR